MCRFIVAVLVSVTLYYGVDSLKCYQVADTSGEATACPGDSTNLRCQKVRKGWVCNI